MASGGTRRRDSGGQVPTIELFDCSCDIGTRRHVELAEDVPHVRLDRFRAEEQALGDLRVRPAVDDEPGDLLLALCQSGDAGRVALAGLRPPMDAAAEQPQLVIRRVAVAARTAA